MNTSDQDALGMSANYGLQANNTDIPFQQNSTNHSLKSQVSYKEAIKKINELMKSETEFFSTIQEQQINCIQSAFSKYLLNTKEKIRQRHRKFNLNFYLFIKSNRRYEDNLRKIDQWRKETKMNFEMSDDDDDYNQENSYDFNFDLDPENQLRQSEILNQKQSQQIDEQIDKLHIQIQHDNKLMFLKLRIFGFSQNYLLSIIPLKLKDMIQQQMIVSL